MRVAVRDVPGCQGCPLFQDGSQGFVPDEIVSSAPVFVLGQNPGREEEEAGKPFVGKTGQTMEKTYFPPAQLKRGAVSIGNTIRCRWQDSNELPPLGAKRRDGTYNRGLAEGAIDHCQRAHFRFPGSVRLVVTQGEYALWAATGERGVGDWRGWLLPWEGVAPGWRERVWTPKPGELSVLATVHLAAIFRDPTLALPTGFDWRKVPKIVAGSWPQPLTYQHESPGQWPQVSAFDTEFDEQRNLERYSLSTGAETWVVEASDVRQLDVPDGVTVIMHNIEADLDHLNRILKGGAIKAEDTMLMDAVLWSDLPHDLGFLGSRYARTNRWKHLFKTSPFDYSAGDALGTWDVYQGLAREMRDDPQSAWIYRNAVFPLTPIIMEAEQVGLLTDQGRVHEAIQALEHRAQDLQDQAQAYAGYPLNLGSSEQVGRWLYDVERLGQKRGRRGL